MKATVDDDEEVDDDNYDNDNEDNDDDDNDDDCNDDEYENIIIVMFCASDVNDDDDENDNLMTIGFQPVNVLVRDRPRAERE